ncbi:MAG: hypothetical protein MUF34_16740 [Polyangiaceae bacterium]|nr:hypothetical protein [Polyangiaceae bacterium]
MNIDAAGLGRLRFPLSAATAQRLRAIARPAPFGKRDETLYDPKVRNTWEVEARLLKIDQRAWRLALADQLAVIQKRLGLPPGGPLEATLDKMLVYEPGQFFAPHHDWGSGYGRRGRRSRHDESEGEDGDGEAEEYELVSLIDREVELRHWVGEGGQDAPDCRPTSSWRARACTSRCATGRRPRS